MRRRAKIKINYLISLDRCRILFCQNRHFIDSNEFQWIPVNFCEVLWMIFDPKSPKLIQSGFGSPSHVQFTKYSPTKCTSKTVQIFLNCGQIRIMLLMNDFEAIWIRSVFGPFVVRFGGASDLYNKRYSFEQNHKMINPNHLRNVQPHLFVEISKNPKF